MPVARPPTIRGAPRPAGWRPPSAAAIGLSAAVALTVAAVVIPLLTGSNPGVGSPPLTGVWRPRLGPGTLPALAIGLVGVIWGEEPCRRLDWSRLLATWWLIGLGWLLSLALVDGPAGIGQILDASQEYLSTARATHDISAMLHGYVSRTATDSPGVWPVHVAGHPPGALLFFVVLVRLGLGGGLAAGLVVTVIASTTPIAVVTTLRTLGAEPMARLALPFLVLAPAAVWTAVSADGLFAAVAAWGLAALAKAAVHRSVAWSCLAGLLLGYCVMLSYGLPLLAILAVAVMVSARSGFPLVPALLAASAVVLAFAVAGFSWWEAYPALRQRYLDGISSERPASYWLWGNVAALFVSAGPVMASGVARLLSRARASLAEPGSRAVLLLCGASVAALVAADLSLMSKAEVERIWLPFIPWLLVSCATLPQRWRRPGLLIQVVVALTIQHLLRTIW